VSTAISPVQKSEIECKTVKLSAKRWNWVQNGEIECKIVKLKMIDSSNKIELGKTEWRTEMRRKLKFNTKTSKQSKIRSSAKVTKLVIAIRNIHKIREVKNSSQTWVDWIEMPELIHDGMTKSQLKKSILNSVSTMKQSAKWDPTRRHKNLPCRNLRRKVQPFYVCRRRNKT